MSKHLPVTETLILHLKESANLGDAVFEIDSSHFVAQEFVQLTETIKSQNGFVQQFWGRQVEDRSVFVWCIDWESFEHSTNFSSSPAYDLFNASLSNVFDLEKAQPLTMFTRFTSAPRAALEAPVTEIAFFTVPESAHSTAISMIENETIEGHPVLTVGRAWGGAIGPVIHTKSATNAATAGHLIALHGVFGYATVEDHYKWRATPEHAKVIEESAESPLAKLGMADAILPGGHIFVPESSMFHVTFHSGN